MRVIAGKFRSRTLRSLEGLETRPTYDRLKETLFNVLASCRHDRRMPVGGSVCGYRLGGHRGAEPRRGPVYFAESSSRAAQVLRQNLGSLGLEAGDVAERDAAEALRQWDKDGVRFDVCFLDPPYRLHGVYGEILRTLARTRLLRTGGIAVAEHEKRFDPGDGEGDLKRYRLLKQGESALSFYRRSAETSDAGEG